MSSKIIGIEIKKDALAALIIKKSLKNFSVEDSRYIKYSDLPVPEKDEPESSYLAKALDIISSEMDIVNCSTAALCIPASFVSFRNINLPFDSKKKIKHVLPFELASHLTITEDNFLSDFLVLDLSLGKDTTDILTASISESLIREYFSLFEKFRIKPALIIPAGYAAANYLIDRDKDYENSIFLDIQSNNIVISVAWNNKIVLIRSIPIYSDREFLVQSINHTIMGFRQKFGLDLIPEICTVTSYDEKSDIFCLCRKLERLLECPVESVDIPRMPVKSESVKSYMYNNVLAAALTSTGTKSTLNLCQGQYVTNTFLKRYTRNLIIIFLFGIVSFSAMLSSIYIDISVSEKKMAGLEQSVTSVFKKNFPGIKKIVDPLKQMQANIAEGKKKSLNSRNIDYRSIDILLELSNQIYGSINVEITNFVLNSGRIALSGNTDNFKNVNKIKELIQKSYMFKEVNISNASSDKTGKKVFFKFIIDI